MDRPAVELKGADSRKVIVTQKSHGLFPLSPCGDGIRARCVRCTDLQVAQACEIEVSMPSA